MGKYESKTEESYSRGKPTKRMGTGGGPFLPNLNSERNPELEVAIPSIAHCVSSVGDSDMMSESQDYSLEFVDELIEVHPDLVSPSGTGLSAVEPVNSGSVETPGAGPDQVASTFSKCSSHLSRSAAVERKLDVRIMKVKRSTDFESVFNEKRMKAAELEIEIKEERLKQLKEEGQRSKEAHVKAMLYLRVEHEQKMINLRRLAPTQPNP